jgi:hypothetical protein
MKIISFSPLVFLICTSMLHGAVNESCEAGSDHASILHIHGRLNVYNGGYPNLRIWQIGTHHMFGIYSDAADLRCVRGGACDREDDDDAKLPRSLEQLNLLDSTIYGDFEIRVLEPFRQGHMQPACIVDADKLIIRRAN